MRLIIAGSRTTPAQNTKNYAIIANWLREHGYEETVTEVVSGTCQNSADILGERWATVNDIRITPYPAKWHLYGNRAGILRNGEMAVYGDELLVLWDGKSPGTKNMIDEMRRRNKPYHILMFDQPETERPTGAVPGIMKVSVDKFLSA